MSHDSSDTTGSNGDDRDRHGRRAFLCSTGVVASGVLAGTAGATRVRPAATRGAAGAPDDRNDEEDPFEGRLSGLTVLTRDPVNAQAADRSTYTKALTPIEEHYVRSSHPVPSIDADEWTVDLGGLGVEGTEIGMAELREEYPTESVAHTMQCAGDGRSFFEPEVDGVPWTVGALGTTVWTGTPVSAVLDRYGVDEEGDWLMAAGGDHPEGGDVFARSLPMDKARADCLLAYEMDGQPLPPEHGFPVRLIVPGWYGHNSVKWVAELEVLDRMHGGEEWARYTNWQHEDYRIFTGEHGPDEQAEIEEFDTWRAMDADAAGDIDYAPYIYDQFVQSVIGYPGEDEVVCPRSQDDCIEVLGVAWAGDDRVEEIEVSTDGGETWSEAEFFGPDRGRFAWRQFRYLWDVSPGEYTLASRATDEHGRTQPRETAHREEGLRTVTDGKVPWNEEGACNAAYLPRAVDVTVRDP